MDKEQLKQLLEREDIKKDKRLHFQLKACEIVINKYGGEPNEWYFSERTKKDNDKTKNQSEIQFNRIGDNKIDSVLIICEYNPVENKKIISTYKSTLSFKSIIHIMVLPEKITVYTPFKDFNFGHLNTFKLENEKEEAFHKVLIQKFDDYCDVEYNYFKQH